MLTKRKGQSIAEYVLIFGVVTGGALASLIAVTGGGQAQRAFENYVTGQSQSGNENTPTPGGGGGSDSGAADRSGAQEAQAN